jgi:UDP-N-acetylglucosamine 2-epimerase (non-hydrolysing)
MSGIFFEELKLPKPTTTLNIGSGSHAMQISRLMLELESMVKRKRPDIIIAEGDTNTVLGAGLTAVKLHVPFGHVEAGLRSYDRLMPEEINRCIAGICAELNFAPTPNAAINLLYEGIPPRRVCVTGNTIVDVVKQTISSGALRKSSAQSKLKPGKNVLLTIHRAESVESDVVMSQILDSIFKVSQSANVIFPVHPRTRRKLKAMGKLNSLQENKNLVLTQPLGYLDFLYLLSHVDLVMTDSGGVQEEAYVLGTPLLTLRNNTERPETVWAGQNTVVGTESGRITELAQRLLEARRKKVGARIPCALGDGNSGRRIAQITVDRLDEGLRIDSPAFLNAGSAVHVNIRVGPHSAAVSEIEKVADLASVTLVYDQNGVPQMPYPELVVNGGSTVRVLGTREALKKVTQFLS